MSTTLLKKETLPQQFFSGFIVIMGQEFPRIFKKHGNCSGRRQIQTIHGLNSHLEKSMKTERASNRSIKKQQKQVVTMMTVVVSVPQG